MPFFGIPWTPPPTWYYFLFFSDSDTNGHGGGGGGGYPDGGKGKFFVGVGKNCVGCVLGFLVAFYALFWNTMDPPTPPTWYYFIFFYNEVAW